MSSQNESNLSRVEKKREYHKLLQQLSLLDNDSVDNDTRIDGSMQVVNKAEDLGKDISKATTSVALLDSYVMRQAGRQALQATRKIEANTNVYNPDKLAQHVLENPEWWASLLPRQVPRVGYLHGAFEATPPPQRPRAPRRRSVQQRNAALVKPENIATLEKPQEDTVMMTRVRRAIRRACERTDALSYFHCVLDPDSFARTVQNIYYVSFLVRDGLVALHIDEQRGIPMIRPRACPRGSERDISQENQFIVSIDMERWQKLIKVFGIKKPLIT